MSIETEQDLETYVQPPEPDHIDLVTPTRLEFKPWHKPRKQFVRKEQWIRHIKGIIDKNDIRNRARPFNYLTLPGPDLLDLRLVADICELEDVKLRYLGFCKADEEESDRLRRNVSEFDISRIERVVSGSKVVSAPIQDIQRKKSEAHVALFQGGTYDAINIDACSPIANQDNDGTGRLIETIRHLAKYQIDNCRDPWMLFLTSPIQTDSISDQSFTSICAQIQNNKDNSSEFADEIVNQFNQGEDLQEYINRISGQNSKEFLSLICLGLTKWLIHLSEQVHYRVKIMKSFCYSTFQHEPFTPNLASLCFLFEPRTMTMSDKTGLTVNLPLIGGSNIGIDDHIRALRKTNEIVNVDDVLNGDEHLRTQMIEETKSLLRQVGYPVDDPATGYNVWLANNS